MIESLPCLLLPLQDKKIILPSSAIAEITRYEIPRILPDAPSWFLGILTCRDIQVPLTILEKMGDPVVWDDKDWVDPKNLQGDYHIALLNRIYKTEAMDGNVKNTKYQFFAILIRKSPNFFRVKADEIDVINKLPENDPRYIMAVKVQNNYVFIPNLAYLWKIIDGLPSRF